MRVVRSAISLNVADVEASSAFVQRHFGFKVAMAADGFASLEREDTFNLIFLRTGLSTFKPERMKGKAADGLLIVFVVEDADAEYERLQREGARILTPIETEAWGERYFQVEDPNGVVIQLVQWVAHPDGELR